VLQVKQQTTDGEDEDDQGASLGVVSPYNVATVAADAATAIRIAHSMERAVVDDSNVTYIATPDVDVPDPISRFPAHFVPLGPHEQVLVHGGIANRVPNRDLVALLSGLDQGTEFDLSNALGRGCVVVIAHCEDGINAREVVAPALDAGAAVVYLADGEGRQLTAPLRAY
jgi:hypothetical protein